MHILKENNTIPPAYMNFSLKPEYYNRNNLFLYLKTLLNEQVARDTCQRYLVGAGRELKGSSLLWIAMSREEIRHCKLCLVNKHNGKIIGKGEVIHRYSKDNKIYVPETATGYVAFPYGHKIDQFTSALNLSSVLYGTHLLSENNLAPVILVESEVTAVIGSNYVPGGIWLAVGHADLLDPEVYSVLKNRNVFIFPNYALKNGKPKLNYWEQKIKDMDGVLNTKIIVSSLVDDCYSKANKGRLNQSISDLLIKQDANAISGLRRLGLSTNSTFIKKYQLFT